MTDISPGWSQIDLCQISKRFARVQANEEVSFSIHRGEVLALLGENGAGKSTIMKILYGLYQADSGKIKIDGQTVAVNTPADALKYGIGMIQQHFSLVPAHTVTENIILGKVRGKIDFRAQAAKIKEISDRYGFPLEPAAKVEDLDVGIQQKVEIVKALFSHTSLLIMDEPTAVLTPQEADQLLVFIRQYAKDGNAVVLITHKLREVLDVADRIVVMRNGKVWGDIPRAEADEVKLSQMMIGHELSALQKRHFDRGTSTDNGLVLENVTLRHQNLYILDHINLKINAGEILGIAGVSGNGQEELCELICGLRSADEGDIFLNGVPLNGMSLRERMHQGIGYVPVDRYRDALVMPMNLMENLYLKSSFDPAWHNGPFINQKLLTSESQKAILDYQVKTPGPEVRAGSLSGGNQQKWVLAREMRLAHHLLVLNQPTRGLDLGAIHYIQEQILDAAARGIAILLISTELSEIFKLSDQIGIMYKGKIMGVFTSDRLNTESVGLMMAGIMPADLKAV